MARRHLDDGIPRARPTRVRVVGPRTVKGVPTGETGVLELTEGQVAALVAAGHIALAADEPPPTHPPGTGEAADPDPPPSDRKTTKKPRRSAGLSHAQTTAAAAEEKKE